jgi:hypothetical protein
MVLESQYPRVDAVRAYFTKQGLGFLYSRLDYKEYASCLFWEDFDLILTVDTSDCLSSIKVSKLVDSIIHLNAKISHRMESRWISDTIEAYLRRVVGEGRWLVQPVIFSTFRDTGHPNTVAQGGGALGQVEWQHASQR